MDTSEKKIIKLLLWRQEKLRCFKYRSCRAPLCNADEAAAAQIRIMMGGVFDMFVTESETYQIYNIVVQTINSITRTLARVSEKVACKYIINKVILVVGLLLFGGSESV
jgi:hypothetical protein